MKIIKCDFCNQGPGTVEYLFACEQTGGVICSQCSDIAHKAIAEQRAKANKGLIERAVEKGRD